MLAREKILRPGEFAIHFFAIQSLILKSIAIKLIQNFNQFQFSYQCIESFVGKLRQSR